jgi:hypothetical protein
VKEKGANGALPLKMRTTMNKKEYFDDVWKVALEKERKMYNTKADIIKTFLGILFFVIIIITLLVFGFFKNDLPSSSFFIWLGVSYFGGAVLSVIATLLWLPIKAYFSLWEVAADRDNAVRKQKLKLESELNKIKSSKPILFAKEDIEDKGYSDGSVRKAVFIDIWNRNVNSDAVKVYPTIEWFDENGKKVITNSGRWHIGNPNAILDQISKQTVDIGSNGMSRRLHFATRLPNDPKLYAWCREKDGNDKFEVLSGKEFTVKIRLKSNNRANASFQYIVNDEKGELTIKGLKKHMSNKPPII